MAKKKQERGITSEMISAASERHAKQKAEGLAEAAMGTEGNGADVIDYGKALAKAKASQLEIPGTERVTHPEIDELASAYRALRDERMAMQTREEAARGLLDQELRKHGYSPKAEGQGQASYRYTDEQGAEFDVYWPDPKLKVKKAKSVGGDDDTGTEIDE